ncbi:leishmanolysin-related zinc metalloendopeptidase [Acaryochloris marina]|uniref:leishmanolysin-related zinc metalloendopeptidase n=1 Tax=Acaryochloris marina TaxID=155978 RepID=UPI001BAF52E4|nr:leishmanolysin-related zinc metalloendopeptidase [Acaryochloris marina]QUY44229.1 hypothetical protein I1H34_09120 [Acaryochloris marina S15]
MESPKYQSNEGIKIEGEITLLMYQTTSDKKKVQLSLFKLTTDDDEIFTFCNHYKESSSSKSINILVSLESLQFFDEYSQNHFSLLNRVVISVREQVLVSIEAVAEKKISRSLKTINQASNFAINASIPIEVFCNSQLASRHQEAFDAAAERWSQIVVGGYPKIGINAPKSEGMIIEVFTSFIDGPGGILGGAKPIDIRAGWRLPNAGWMILDSSDIERMDDQDILVDVILHEIGHLLGLGTLWQASGLTQGIGGSNPVFVGQKTMSEYARLTGYTAPIPVPLENRGGFGTRDFHWRESMFGNELMTGLVDGKINPISRLTIAALEDIGYQVNYDAADLYSIKNFSRLKKLNDSTQGISGLYCSVK